MNVVSLRRPAPAPRKLGCSACGATAEAACDCGVPYDPAGQRAAAAVAAHPEKSDRAIAADIGVGKNTVMRARQSDGPDGPPERRVGKDGKRDPAKKPDPIRPLTKKQDADAKRGCFMLSIQEAKNLAVYDGAVDRAMIDFAKKAASAWCELVEKLESRNSAKTAKPPPVVDHDDDSTTDTDHEEGLRVIAARGLINRAGESATMARYPLGSLVITNEIVTAARDAAQSWSDLVAKLSDAKDDDDSEIAAPAVLEDNLLHAIGGMKENARVFKKLLRASALDHHAIARMNAAIDGMVERWLSTQRTLFLKAT